MTLTPVAHRPRNWHGHIVSSSEALDWVVAVVDETGTNECRDWPGSTGPKGYGQMGYGGRTRQVGHVVLELSGRPRPSREHHQMHSCDRPICAAPWHLEWGTNLQNRAESVAKDRHCRGERSPLAKLTDTAVTEIRTSDESLDQLAERFGVKSTTVWEARRGHTWRHVPTPPKPGRS